MTGRASTPTGYPAETSTPVRSAAKPDRHHRVTEAEPTARSGSPTLPEKDPTHPEAHHVKTRNTLTTILAIGAIGALIAGCGGGREEETAAAGGDTAAAASDLTGAIVIDGSSTVAPLATLIAERFESANPGVSVTVGTSGTGGGFEKFCAGETDISNASRAIKDEEVALCGDGGVEYTELLVANDGIAIVANPENDWATCLTVDQLALIWGPDSTAMSWKDIDPSFPNEPLKLYGPGTDSGTFDFFTDAINGEEGASRTDYSPAEDDNVTIQGVTGETGGLGYFGLSYYEENKDKLNLIEVDNGSGCVAPSAETVQAGAYAPLSRPLFMYVSAAAAERPEVLAFAQYFRDNEEVISTEALFVPLSGEQIATLQSEVDSLKG
jgi:phosphate transport system substrate-binding protein